MTLTKILKRKDGSSIVAAILLALIISQPLSNLTGVPAGKLLNLPDRSYIGYIEPGRSDGNTEYQIIWAILQIIVLEILCWAFVMLVSSFKNAKKN